MKYFKKNRKFKVGLKKDIIIYDKGKIQLENNEMVSLISSKTKDHDICKKAFGYYLSPSINRRVLQSGFKLALVKNYNDDFYLFLVEKTKINIFKKYLKKENNYLVTWLEYKQLKKIEGNIKK